MARITGKAAEAPTAKSPATRRTGAPVNPSAISRQVSAPGPTTVIATRMSQIAPVAITDRIVARGDVSGKPASTIGRVARMDNGRLAATSRKGDGPR